MQRCLARKTEDGVCNPCGDLQIPVWVVLWVVFKSHPAPPAKGLGAETSSHMKQSDI